MLNSVFHRVCTNEQIFTNKDTPVPASRSGLRDCAEVQSAGHTQSGRYTVYPDDGGDPFSVYCDMDTSGGGWTVRSLWCLFVGWIVCLLLGFFVTRV